RKVLPRLLRAKSSHEPIRIWIPGCSTGEEVYSLAMLMMEMLMESKTQRSIQIFGTDISNVALEKARVGFYPESIQQQVSATRLRNFFTRSNGGYRINKTIREVCIFARQNLAADPPFSNLDLISCRNVLIYLAPLLQRKVMPVFHYALRPTGLLLRGSSETVGNFGDLFAPADKKLRLYSKKMGATPAVRFSPAFAGINPADESRQEPAARLTPDLPDVQKQADRIVLTGVS